MKLLQEIKTMPQAITNNKLSGTQFGVVLVGLVLVNIAALYLLTKIFSK